MEEAVMFVPRAAGNLNEGQVYERKVLLFVAASLSQNDEVDDFWLVSNPVGVDKFDDVIVKVSFKDNRKNIAIFIQVKHTEVENKSLWLNRQRTKKRRVNNDCEINLEKYEKAFDDVMCIKSNDQTEKKQLRESKLLDDVDQEDYFMCIFTNIREVDPILPSKHLDRSHPIHFLDTSTFGEYRDYIFRSSNTNQTSQIKQLFIFLGQPNVDDIDYTIANLLGSNFINKLVNLDKTIKEYMQRGNNCAILTRRSFEIQWLKVLLEDWLLDDLGQVEEINPEFRDLWCQIFSIQQIVNLRDAKIWPLLACYYEYVVRKEIDINFNWRTGVTESTTHMIRENYGENVTNKKELLILLWYREEIPLPIKPEHTKNILEFVDKFKTVGRRFVVFSGDEYDELITDVRHISKIGTLKEALKVEVSIQGRLPVPLLSICEGISMEKEETIRSAVDGIFNSLKLSQLLAWTKNTAPGSENQHVIGPLLPRPDNMYITRNFMLKQDKNNEIEQEPLTEATVLEYVKPGLHIIIGEPGMGKTTVLQALAQGYLPRNFLIYIKLRDCLDDIENSAVLKVIKSDPLKFFFSKMTSNSDDKFVKSIMEVHRTCKRLCLYLDAFDEILPLHEKKVISLMTTILENTDVPIFCTTRPHAEEKLTRIAGSISFILLPFDDKQIDEYFTKTNINRDILWTLGSNFLSNPLHLHMMSAIYQDHENCDDITKAEMYKLFIDMKHKTYNKRRGLSQNDAHLSIVKSMKQHRELALVEIFGEKDVISTRLTSYTGLAEALKDICDQNIGIVDVRHLKKSFQFVHRTFAEYFVVDFLLTNIVQSVLNTEKCNKPCYKAVWNTHGTYEDIKQMIEERTRHENLWFKARKYFFINSDNKNKSSTCACDGFSRWLECTVSHPNVNGSTIVHSINMDYPTRTRLTEDNGDTCIKLLTAIHAEDEEDVESNVARPLLETGMGIVAFNLAITTGNERIVKILLDLKPTLVDEQDVNGNTGLHISCAMGYSTIAGLLFEHCANIDIRNNKNTTPLGMATKNERWGIWKIKHIGEISKRLREDGHASTVKYFSLDLLDAFVGLHSDQWYIRLEDVKHLLGYVVDPSISDGNGVTLMHAAARTGNEDIIDMLVKIGFNINKKTNGGQTPLDICLDTLDDDLDYFRHGSILPLLKNGAEPPLPDDDGETLMHRAAYDEGFGLEIIKILSSKGFNVNEKTNDGETPLTIAAKWGKWDIAKWLLEHGADLTASDETGWTSIHFAAEGGDIEIIEMLWDRGVNINDKTNNGKTPFTITCEEGRWAIAKKLLEHGADPTVSDENGWTSIHFAAKGGDIEMIEMLWDRGVNVNDKTNDGKTPLTIACEGRRWDIAKRLLEHGADPTVFDENGWTSIHFAAKGRDIEMIEMLWDRGVNVNDKTNDGKTPLTIACEGRRWDIAKRLLEQGADPTVSEKNGWTSIHFAAKGGDIEMIEMLWDRGVNVNDKTNDGKTPLTIACEEGRRWDIAKRLLEHGADPTVSEKNGWTSIHFVAKGGDIEMIEMLWDRGVNVNDKTNDGKTPLTIACEGRRWDIVKRLLEHSADPTVSDENGWTSIHFAAKGGDIEMIEMLWDRGVNVNDKTNDGKTPLTIACEGRRWDIAKRLLEHGADPTVSDENGWTSIHFAAKGGDIAMIEMLWDRGVNVNDKTNDGKTPLTIACEGRRWDIAKRLLEHGADPTVSDENVRTCIHIAAKLHIEMIKMLFDRGVNVNDKTNDDKTPLTIACEERRWDIAKRLLEHGADPTVSDENGWASIHFAAKGGDIEIIEMLWDRGVNVNNKTNDGKTPFTIACEERRWDIAKRLLEHGADPTVSDENGWASIHFAAKGGDIEIIEMLWDRGVNVNEKTSDGKTPLTIAFEGRRWDIAKRLLEHGADPTVSDQNGWASIHFAAKGGNIEIIEMLWNRGFNVNEKTNDGKTPLTIACEEQRWDIAKWLMEHDAEPTVSDENGWASIHFAAKRGIMEIIEMLWNRGFNVNEKTNDGKTPLTIACENGGPKMVKYLLDHHADPTIADKDGWTPIHFAAKKPPWYKLETDKLQTMKVMLDKRLNINIKTKDGQTPLAIARSEGFTDMVELLLAHGADES